MFFYIFFHYILLTTLTKIKFVFTFMLYFLFFTTKDFISTWFKYIVTLMRNHFNILNNSITFNTLLV